MKRIAILLAALTLGAAACGKPAPVVHTPVSMTASNANPAAHGQVLATDASNGNTSLSVEVKHMAEPAKIAPGAKSYVVWVKPAAQGAAPQNIGALVVDSNLSGSLMTITPLKVFDVFITAEPSTTATEPTGEKVLWTRIERE